MPKLVFINARTGCSCCSDQNHYRGPYKSKADAERRIAYYKSENSKYWPTASQYARRGCYDVVVYEAEEISNNRWIIEDSVFSVTPFMNVAEDGSLVGMDDEDERFCDEI